MTVRATMLAVLLVVTGTTGPAMAGKLIDAAPQAMREYADQAGYILASVKVCGGDPKEEEYFRGLARDTLVQLGADDDDIGFLDHYMAEAAVTAKPRKRECQDENAVPLTAQLFNHRKTIEEALKAQ